LTRGRIAIVAVVVALFVIAGGVLIYANQTKGGANVTLNVTVIGASKMTPSELSAHQNDTVTINVTSDTTGEVHLHGYDIHFNCTAGQVTSHTFKADKTGHFDIEWESTSAPLGELVVT
jgi:heme/copper-type cytochrome/quinol oxidase subunit 2